MIGMGRIMGRLWRWAGFGLGVLGLGSALLTAPAMAAPPRGEPKALLGENSARDVMQSVMGEVLPPGTDPAALPEPESSGAQLLQRYCVQCHELPGPGLHTGEEWPAVVARMQDRILRLSDSERTLVHVTPLNTGEMTELLRYLKRYGYLPLDSSNYPDLDTDIGKAFSSVCSQCHALPDPKLHNKFQWREVVRRMRRNMELLGMTDPGDDAIAKALGFLETHAAP